MYVLFFPLVLLDPREKKKDYKSTFPIKNSVYRKYNKICSYNDYDFSHRDFPTQTRSLVILLNSKSSGASKINTIVEPKAKCPKG